MSYYRIFSKIYERAAQKMCLDCQDFIQRDSKILDLGCGSGIVAKALGDFFQSPVLGVDIEDKRIVNIPFQIIDGKNLPFPENSFDVVLISYVLHHSQDPLTLLKEAKRVSKRIIIYEDLPDGFLSKLVCWFHGISFDKIWGNPNRTSFRAKREWKNIFSEIGLNLVFEKEIKNFPVKKELFILETTGA